VTPAARKPVTGAVQVARFVLGLVRRAAKETDRMAAEPVLVNGALGLLLEADYADGQRMRMVMAFAIEADRITGVFNQINPAKLARVPALDPATPGWPLQS